MISLMALSVLEQLDGSWTALMQSKDPNPWRWSEVGAGAFGANQQADTEGEVTQQAETKPAASIHD